VTVNSKKLEEAERAYCERIAAGLLEYEIDPRNFTREMRTRNAFARRGASSSFLTTKPSQSW
jgi:hypothetical protein